MMRQRFLVSAVLVLSLGLGAGLARTAVAQEGPKNLKFFKGMGKAELKKTMKGIAGALGVQCDHCHDTDDMAKDTPKKEAARTMLFMTDDVNKKYFKGEAKVTCVTCHNGKSKPAKK